MTTFKKATTESLTHCMQSTTKAYKEKRQKHNKMLQLQFIRENKEAIIEALKKRNFDATEVVNEVISLDEARRSLQVELDNTLASSNKLSKEIGQLFKSGERQKGEILREKSTQLKAKADGLKTELKAKEEALPTLLYTIPNVPNALVPAGNSEEDNEEIVNNSSSNKD